MEIDRCRDLRGMYVDYAADRLATSETMRVQLHLGEGCAACAVEIEQLMEAFHAVPLGQSPVALPSEARDLLLEEAGRTGQEERDEPVLYPETDQLRLWKVLTALAAVAVVAVAYWGSGKVERGKALEEDVQNASRAGLVEVRSLERQLETARSSLAGVGNPRAMVVDLAGEGVRARAFVDREGGSVALSSEPLGAPPEGSLHHAWLVGDSAALLGVFPPGYGAQGGQIRMRLPEGSEGKLLVTLEDASARPTAPSDRVVLREK